MQYFTKGVLMFRELELEKKARRILDVPWNANQSDIKKAYRSMIKDFHPDKRPGDRHLEEKFKAITEAYEILTNKRNNKTYTLLNIDTDFKDSKKAKSYEEWWKENFFWVI